MTRYLLVFVIAIMLVLLVSAQAMAYRVVLIPSGDVLPEGMVKLEYGHVVNPDHHSPPGIDWFSGYKLDARLPGNFEVYVNVKDTDDEFGASDLATDVSVQYLALQETEKLPNLSVGVWNINQDSPSPAGDRHQRSFWVGASKAVPLPSLIKRSPRFTLGAGTDLLQGFWGGVIIFTSPFASIAAEYDPQGIRMPNAGPITVAFGYNWTPHLRTKYANLGGDSAFGVVYTDWFGKK